ncbi:MAG: polyprenyl synthetase family protein [Candidatus Delongbacteria bacterium]|jgi:geranylgeranyl diphosphate synthase type II|nr:polyprenyl synthetase family protein [Candidatus Delongbacteria bacterium]
MEFTDKLNIYRDKINDSLDQVLQVQEPKLLYEPMKYIIEIGGKRIRPILCEIFYRMFNGEKDKVLYPALAIELLHNFTLVHDDIMDDDDKRRNKPTVHVKWDLAVGVLAGDGVVSLAYKVLLKEKFNSSDKIINIFTEGLLEVCEGQGFDKEFETRADVTEEEYVNMIDKKTSALLAVSTKIGAACADVDNELLEIASQYGRALGLAFQIQDDYLDIAGDEKLLGKTYGSDVQKGKKTYLYIKAKEKLTGEDLNKFNEIIEKEDVTREEILTVRDIYERNGILDDTNDEIVRRIELAKVAIEKLSRSYDTQELIEFTEYMLNRKF